MTKFWPLLLALLLLPACGGFKFFPAQNTDREIASSTVQKLLSPSTLTFSEELDEKFQSLHAYNIIGQRLLLEFDENIIDSSLSELYQSPSYLGLLAVKAQMDDIENELKDVYFQLDTQGKKKTAIFLQKLKFYSEKSPSSHSFQNLKALLGLSHELTGPAKKEVENEYLELSQRKDFMIYEKNIEHLSHLFEINVKSDNKNFKPSERPEGNVTGEEFPAKVWALTFNNGPSETATKSIVQNLKLKNLRATFFMLAGKVKEELKIAHYVKESGMQVALNSYSNKDLTKVGGLTLEREIDGANNLLGSALNVKISFIRLPYGSGITVPSIRQMVVKNNMVHVLWNVDTLDWMAQSPDKIVARAKRLMKKTRHDSGIILFHDVNMRSVKASLELMDVLKADARRVCTLDKIIKDINQGVSQVCAPKLF